CGFAAKAAGLADQAQSWVSTGQNMPVSGEQMHNVLGADMIQKIAAKLGIDPSQASEGMAHLLPNLIDKLTPNGAVPQSGSELEQGFARLRKLVG
ncbi:MAG: YidB family protein, partial [Burkholderiales bacterium]